MTVIIFEAQFLNKLSVMTNMRNTSLRAICFAFFLLALISPLFWECKKTNPDGPPATTLDSTLATPVSYISIPIYL